MFDLTGKKALVTGSARGIGRAIAEDLAKAGAEVILHGVKASDHLKALSAAMNNARYVTGDMGNPEEIAVLIKEVGDIDILVLNSSVQSYTGLDNFNMEEFSRMVNTNLASAFSLIAAFAPKMAERKFGRIIAVSSINQLRPAPRLAVYSATKAALANLMNMTAKKYAADGVTANTIQPGVIVTDRNREVLKNEDFASGLRNDIPARRFGMPEDCSPIVTFLASDEASYITGAQIPVAGGWQL